MSHRPVSLLVLVPPQTVSKYNSQYHKLFQTVPKEEILMKGDCSGAPLLLPCCLLLTPSSSASLFLRSAEGHPAAGTTLHLQELVVFLRQPVW